MKNVVIVRRRKLGLTSCNGLANESEYNTRVRRHDRGLPNADVYVRWGCTATLPIQAQVVNKARAIGRVNDKMEFRKLLEDAELCPRTWFDKREVGAVDGAVIVRPRHHSQGKDMHLCHNNFELDYACDLIGEGEYYINEYIPKMKEYRVYVVAGRAVAVAEKVPYDRGAVAWNHHDGGSSFVNVKWGDWPLKAVKRSIQAFNLSKLDFGGVDVIVDSEGNSYVLEINSAPSLTSEYRQKAMSKAIDMLIKTEGLHYPLTKQKGGWRKFIHPAVSDEARLMGSKVCVE